MRHSLQRQGIYLSLFLSGSCALIYEVAWLRLLGRIFGNTTLSLSIVLATYMAGLGLGSMFLGKIADRLKNPLRSYSFIEIGIGIYGLVALPLVFMFQCFYVWLHQTMHLNLLLSTVLRGVITTLLILIPTFLMGGTLPVLSRYFVHIKEEIGSKIAFIYALNTLGAVFGTLAAGFYLLPSFGLTKVFLITAALNIAIGLFCFQISKNLQPSQGDVRKKNENIHWTHREGVILGCLLATGITAMMYEIAWTRILAMVLLSSTYAFSAMLACFLLGLALGGFLFEKTLKKNRPSFLYWSCLQILLSLTALATIPYFGKANLFVVQLFSWTSGNYALFQLSLFGLCLLLMIVPCICFGALLPVAGSLYIEKVEQVGEKFGRLYLFNSFGNIFGALLTGLILIPWIGIHKTILLAIALNFSLAFLPSMLLEKKQVIKIAAGFLLIGGLAVIYTQHSNWDLRLISSGINLRPQALTSYTRNQILSEVYKKELLFYKEGPNGIVAVGQTMNERYLSINGKTDASTGADMLTQLLFGHLPHLFHPSPKKTLIVGLGSGVTLAASARHDLQKIDCIEIEPAVTQALNFFKTVHQDVVSDPKVHLIVNDARNQLLLSAERYDVIISEPSNPWMAGISNLFTLEFYRLVEQRLNPDGIFAQWMHLYSISPDDFKMVIATLKSAFPHLSVWVIGNDDALILASREPVRLDLELVQRKINASPKIQDDLEDFGLRGSASPLAFLKMGGHEVDRFVKGGSLNTDDKLPLEYNAPKALYKNYRDNILEALEEFVFSTEDILSASSANTSAQAWSEIGYGYLAANQLTQAKHSFQKALHLNTDYPSALVGLGRCYQLEDALAEASELLEKAKTPLAYFYLAEIELRSGQEKSALEAIDNALTYESDNWEWFYMRGKILSRFKRWQEAVAAYQTAKKFIPTASLNSEKIRFKLELAHASALLASKTTLFEATNLLENLRESYPLFPSVYIPLKEAYEATGQTDKAIVLYEELVKANPYELNLWEDLSHLYKTVGRKEKLSWAKEKIKQLGGGSALNDYFF